MATKAQQNAAAKKAEAAKAKADAAAATKSAEPATPAPATPPAVDAAAKQAEAVAAATNAQAEAASAEAAQQEAAAAVAARAAQDAQDEADAKRSDGPEPAVGSAAWRRADYLRALTEERHACTVHGKDDRLKAIDAEIKRVKSGPVGRNAGKRSEA